jgi:hypothetical protein
MMLISGALGGLGNLLGGGGGYQQIGSASDVTNVNPFTGTSWNLLTGNLGNYDYTQPFNYFTSQLAPELQGISTSGPYAESQLNLAQSQANDIRQNLAQQYGGNNALFSGAFGKALGAGVAEPYMSAVANITGQQSNLLGGLYSGAMSQLGQMYQMPYNMAGQYGMPTFYEPNYGYQQSPFQNFMSGFGGGVGIGGSFASLPQFGGGGAGGGGSQTSFMNSAYPAWVYGMSGFGRSGS